MYIGLAKNNAGIYRKIDVIMNFFDIKYIFFISNTTWCSVARHRFIVIATNDEKQIFTNACASNLITYVYLILSLTSSISFLL